MDKLNYKKVLVFTALLLGIVTVFSISFAYFTVEIREGDLFTTKGGVKGGTTPDITYTENKTGITLNNTYPMPNSAGIKLKDPYTFTVANNEASSVVNVSVMFEVADTSTLDDTLVNYQLDSTIETFGGVNTTRPSEDGFKTAYVIDSYTLNAGESKTSNMRLWINENGTLENAQNKTWAGRIVVVANFVE